MLHFFYGFDNEIIIIANNYKRNIIIFCIENLIH